MKILAILALLVLQGCSVLDVFKNGPAKPAVIPAVEQPVEPVVVTQQAHRRDVYTGIAPYVLCFGRSCDEPTKKHLIPPGVMRPQARPTVQPTANPRPLTEAVPEKPRPHLEYVRDSVRYEFNTTEITEDGEAVIKKLADAAKEAREVKVEGLAGLTASNEEKEREVLSLAFARAKDTSDRLKAAGVAALIHAQARLERCKTEQDCLERHKYGGRRSDVEITVIKGDTNAK